MLLFKIWKYWFDIEHTKWNIRSCVEVISIKGLIFSHWHQEVNSVLPFVWCFYWKKIDIHDSIEQYLHDVIKRGDEMAVVVQMKHAF